MPLLLRLTPKGGEGSPNCTEPRKKLTTTLLKRTPTFATLLRKEVLGLRSFDPMFRYSLTRLQPEGADGGKKSVAEEGDEGRCGGVQWANIRSAAERVIWHCMTNSSSNTRRKDTQHPPGPLAEGELSILHSDVRVLLRSEAGAFIFEYLKDKLLPGAAAKVLDEIKKRSRGEEKGDGEAAAGVEGEGQREELDTRKLCSVLSHAWENFYSHSLVLLEAIFYQVKSRSLGMRHAGLMTFRDHIVLPLKPELETLLKGYKPAGESYQASKDEVPPVVRQMLLILQSVNESCPPSCERLKLESLVARAITPYLGFKGLYEDGNPVPIRPSQELAVIHRRRPSVVDPRRLNLPLSVAGTGRVETLSELFTLSADRVCHKKNTNRNTPQ